MNLMYYKLIVATSIIGAFLGLSLLVVEHYRYHGTTTEVYLDQPITEPADFRSLVVMLKKAQTGDKIVFHVIGNGGDALTLEELVNNIHSTKAETYSIVEGDCFSAHAYLAASTQHMTMCQGTFLMFHTVSTHNMDCEEYKGKLDRGHDAYNKCLQTRAAIDYGAEIMIDDTKILAPEEKEQLKEGYDVYLTADEIRVRQTQGLKAAHVSPIMGDFKFIQTRPQLQLPKSRDQSLNTLYIRG